MNASRWTKITQPKPRSPGTILFGLLRMFRLPNCVMMGLAVIIGEVMALKGGLQLWPAVLGFVVGFILLAAAMTTNDYFDLEIDRINQPHRPLPSGSVRPNEALWIGAFFVVVGLVLAALINVYTLGIGALSQVLMAYYNARGKKTGLLGNAVVSVNVALPFVFGGYAIGNMNLALGLFALLSFLSSLGREVTKGIADVPGDSKSGIRTVAVRFGSRAASRIGASFLLLAVLLSVIPLTMGLVSWFYIPWVIVSDLGFTYTSLSLLRSPTEKNAAKQKRLVLLWMTLGLMAFLLGAISPSD